MNNKNFYSFLQKIETFIELSDVSTKRSMTNRAYCIEIFKLAEIKLGVSLKKTRPFLKARNLCNLIDKFPSRVSKKSNSSVVQSIPRKVEVPHIKDRIIRVLYVKGVAYFKESLYSSQKC